MFMSGKYQFRMVGRLLLARYRLVTNHPRKAQQVSILETIGGN
jgi:hypothetical protein